MQINSDNNEIRRVTLIGMLVNILLSILKIVFGFLSGAISLIADGVHSFSDMLTDLAVIIGTHFGSRQPDEKHPYGHGRLETFSTIAVAVILVTLGGEMIRRSAVSIASGQITRFSWPVVIVAAVSVFSKEWLFHATRNVARKTHSAAAYANAWHHRSDALSSIAVIIGIVSAGFGFRYGDQLAAACVGLMVILVAVKILGDCIRELTEASVDQDTLAQIKLILSEDKRVRQWHKLRSRLVGREVFVDFHILVEPSLSVVDAHQIAENLENKLYRSIERPINIIVHVEPDLPSLRK